MLGLCPEAVREGDAVVLLPGCQSPVVLRERVTDEGKVGWEFVGAVYVQSVNEGGLARDVERGRLPRQVFDIR